MPHILVTSSLECQGSCPNARNTHPELGGTIHHHMVFGVQHPEVPRWLSRALVSMSVAVMDIYPYCQPCTLPQFQFDLNSLPNMSPALQVLFSCSVGYAVVWDHDCSPRLKYKTQTQELDSRLVQHKKYSMYSQKIFLTIETSCWPKFDEVYRHTLMM